jgi:hypothetical protein
MREYAQELKQKTAKGAILAIDGEIWDKPRWWISDEKITVRSGNCIQLLWERGESPKIFEKHWRKRIRVLVDA